MFQTPLQLDTGRKCMVGQEDYFEGNVGCTVLYFTEIKLFRKKNFEATAYYVILFVRMSQASKSVLKFLCTLSMLLFYVCFLRMF
jgi:hypothetical protein